MIEREWVEFFQQLHKVVAEQKKQIEQLQQEVSQLKKQPLTVEYHIDQLKVEKLEGTLNIGLSPHNDKAEIEDFEVTNRKLQVQPNEYENPTIEQDIFEEVATYLQEHGLGEISQLEGKYQVTLNDHYRQLMIDDVSKQIQARIPYYFSKMRQNRQIMSNPDLLHRTVVEQMKHDIHQAFIAFIEHFPKGERK